jgi:type IV secretion system protein TrbL
VNLMNRKTIIVATGLVCAVATVHAQNATSDVGGTFQQVQTAANAWIPAIMAAATRLFYLLAAIDFAWSTPSFLRESDFMGLFLSLIKKLLVISFFYAVLINGQTWIPAIVNSFITIGTNATGLSAAQSPSDIMAQGIQICSDLFDKVNGANLLTQTGAALTTILMIVMVFASYLIIVLHYIVTKLEAIIVMTAGYIFLGFAGSRWTMPYFERYISLAISTGVRLMLIYLMLGVFKTVSQNWVTAMDSYTPDQPALQIFPTLASMLLFAFASWMIPKMAGSIASGSLGLGGADIVNAGAAAATGAALAVATVASGGALAAGGMAAAGAGGIEALGAVGGDAAVGASSSMASGAADVAAGGAGVPAPVGPPPGGGVNPISEGPPPGPPAESSSASMSDVAAGPSRGTETPMNDDPIPAESSAGDSSNPQSRFNFGRQKNRNLVPDDGSEHTPPPQLRMEGEE